KVKAGDILAEIETDKATMEYEAVDEGVIAKILVPEGTADVAVNAPIAVLAAEGEDVKAAAAAAPAGRPAGGAPGGAGHPQAAASPPPRAPASPKRGRDEPAPPQNPSPSSGRVASASEPGRVRGNGRIFASPLARRLAKAAGIEIGRIAGSGPHGRIIARDVE